MKLQNVIHILMGIVCIGLLPRAQAACDSPDPGCPVGNLAEGYLSLAGLVSGAAYNTGIGAYSLLSNTTGSFNTGVGAGALFSNTTATENTTTGAGALFSNNNDLDVGANTADGAFALFSDTTGHHNTAVGNRALFANTTGVANVAIGSDTLGQNSTGLANTAVGDSAGDHLTTGAHNVFIGTAAGFGIVTGDGNICIGSSVVGLNGASDSTYIGNISSTAQPIVGSVDGVTIDLTTSKLGHGVSSRRFKEQIKPMDTASEALYALKPVTFHYNKAIDPTQTLDFGLIAEEVAAVNPELAVRDREGKISNYRHDAVNAMLLNEFLKEHKAFVSQQHTLEQQQATITRLEKQIEALTAGLQKVSAQLEVSKPAPQTVLNNQ